MKLYIARHGEAEDDINNTYGGIADDPLTDVGREQAKNLARLLRDHKIEAILTSPLSRATETAEIIARELDLTGPPTVMHYLRERNAYGVLSGVNKDRAKILFHEVLKNLTKKPGYSDEPIPGAEDFSEFLQRVHEGFRQVIALMKERNIDRVAIISHGTFTRALFEHVLQIGDQQLPSTEIVVVDYTPAVVKSDRLL